METPVWQLSSTIWPCLSPFGSFPQSLQACFFVHIPPPRPVSMLSSVLLDTCPTPEAEPMNLLFLMWPSPPWAPSLWRRSLALPSQSPQVLTPRDCEQVISGSIPFKQWAPDESLWVFEEWPCLCPSRGQVSLTAVSSLWNIV